MTTSSTRKNKRVLAVDDSLLKRTEGLTCRVDPHGEGCSLPGLGAPGAQIRTLPSLVHSTGYYCLLIFQTGGEEAASRTLRGMKKDFKALGHLVKKSGAQVLFFSFPPFSSDDMGWNKRI